VNKGGHIFASKYNEYIMNVIEGIKCYSSVEDVLGPKSKRYCSTGFKNVNFSFSNMTITNSSLEAKVHVDFSKKWSSKNDESLNPHLGTTEYFNISVILSELLLISYFELDDLTVSKSWVSHLKMKAKPAGDQNLIQDVKVNYNGTFGEGSIFGESSFDISIGHMMVQLTIVHEIKKTRTEAPFVDLSIFLKRLEHHFNKKGYKETETDIRDIELDLSAQSVHSVVNFKSSPNKCFGIGSFYQTMNIANFILLSGQLMQVLLYELEGIGRDQSRNLWLRGLEINFNEPVSTMNTEAAVYCQTFKELMLRGERWRVADFAVSMDTLSAKFSMTHQIVY